MDEVEKLKERISFLEDFIKNVLANRNQFESYFEDWKKKQGIFRSNEL